jgi:hypothetical protein
LEEIVLTRNDFQHNADLLSPYTFQDEKHKEKYPNSSFRHPTWSALLLRNSRLHVNRGQLVAAVEAVRILANYLDDALRTTLLKIEREVLNFTCTWCGNP